MTLRRSFVRCLKESYLDIEVYANDGKFPEPSEAAYPINAISISFNQKARHYAPGAKDEHGEYR